MLVIRIWLLGLSLIMCAELTAATRSFVADLEDVRWESRYNRLECRLSQVIPFYGEAVFFQNAGESEGFVMDVITAARQDDQQGYLKSTAPPWFPGQGHLDLAIVDIRVGKSPFLLGTTLAQRMLAELEQGRFITFFHNDWNDNQDQFEASISPVALGDNVLAYRQCKSRVLDFKFEQIRTAHLLFDLGKSELNAKALTYVRRVAEYYSVDPTYLSVEIDGHADNIGRRRDNDELSQARADNVYNLLIQGGVPADLIIVKAYGERRPLVSNRTSKGRAKNRRVMVRIEKGPTQVVSP